MEYKLLYYILSVKYLLAFPLYFKIIKDKFVRDEFFMYLRNDKCPLNGWLSFVWLFRNYPEYRNVLYCRFSDIYTKIISVVYKKYNTLYLQVDNNSIGANLMVWHGFSSIINARSIGSNCSIWQQVTIGNKLDQTESKPRIGDNVKICAGSIIVGDISVGNNVIIGAGTVVVKDVPDNTTVVGMGNRVLNNH